MDLRPQVTPVSPISAFKSIISRSSLMLVFYLPPSYRRKKDMDEYNLVNHILMADDDRDHALLFGRTIKKEFLSIKISYVTDGNELMQFLRLNNVDMLFLDINMPCKNGYECLLEIRDNPSFEHIPIIVYSSSAHLSDIQKSFLHNADFYLVKPFVTEHLKRALRMILSVDWRDNPPIKRHYFINNSFVPFTASS